MTFDADDVRQPQDRVECSVVVRNATGGVVEIEGDDGQVAAQRFVVGDRVRTPRESEQRVGAAVFGVARHLLGARPGDEHLARQRHAPRGEHEAALLGREVIAAPGVRPHRYAGDGLRGHPGCIGALRVVGDAGLAKRDGDRGNEAPL